METQTQEQKKKLPGWVKLIIILAAIGIGLSVIASVGMGILAGFLSSKTGEMAAKKGIEALIEKGIEKSGGGKADVDLNEGGLVIKDKESGQQFAIRADQKLPVGFPGDIPVFSPAEVTGSMVMGPLTMVTLESASPVQNVSNFYQNQLPAQGWTATFTSTPSPDTLSALYKKEKRQLTLSVTQSGAEKTSIVLSYGLEQAQP